MDEEIPHHTRRSFLATGAAVVAASGAGVATKDAQSAEPRSATVSTYADALGRAGRDPMSLSMTPDVKPLTPSGGTIIGPAVTSKWQADNTRMSADEVRKEGRRYCDVLGRDGGYILGPAHLFQPDVPPENVLAMFAALDDCGKH